MKKHGLTLLFLIFLFSFSNSQNTCADATSLCGSFDTSFPNTTGFMNNTETEFDYDCLGSQPNPKWFYIPIGGSGDVEFQISQFTNADETGTALDVDFIVWGPFDNVTCNAADLSEDNVIDCSYSASSIENVTMTNVQPGEVYMLMVTNFSDEAGYIKMTETTDTNLFDVVDCTGFTFNAFLDSNGNDIKDEGEQSFPHGYLNYSVNNGANITLNNNNGKFYIFDNNDTNIYNFEYTINPSYTAYYGITSPIISNQTITPGVITNFNIPIDITQAYHDASISIVELVSPNPGFNTTQLITYSNLANVEIPSGSITYNFDNNTTFISSDDPNTIQNSNTLTIPFTNLLPFETREILIVLNTNTPPTVNIDDILSFSTQITINGLNDINVNNNSFTLDAIVIGSYDPNDKLESHGGSIIFEDFTTDDYLTYTIRFQNTGTAPAQNVIIKDFLTDELDGSTVKMISASHNYQLKKMGQDLEWEFRNINLPDSTNDEPNSHGYIQFKIKPTSGYDINTVFENTAEIYFDFNLPIITETNVTLFSERLNINDTNVSKITYYPNPTSGNVYIKSKDLLTHIKVSSVLGQVIISKTINTKETSIDLHNYPNGNYFITLQSANGQSTYRLVKN